MKSILFNVQIISALIWATAIIASSYMTENKDLIMFLVAAAGMHVIMLTMYTKDKSNASI